MHRLLADEVVKHHHRPTMTFHFMGVSVEHLLLKFETGATNLCHTCSPCNVVACLDLPQELSLDFHHDNSHLLPVHILAHTREVVCLRGVVELELDRIVHMTKLIDIIEANLQRQNMSKYLICHLTIIINTHMVILLCACLVHPMMILPFPSVNHRHSNHRTSAQPLFL